MWVPLLRAAAAPALAAARQWTGAAHTALAASLPLQTAKRSFAQDATSEASATPKFFVTGACGQVGSEFVPFLRDRVGADNVIASDVKAGQDLLNAGPFAFCDVTDKEAMSRIIVENGATHIVHLASLLSAVGERNPALALRVNMRGIQNVLELAVKHKLAVYAPSTIAVFGPSTPRVDTPDSTIKEPTTMYGITKVHQELLGDYYAKRYGVDYRSLRYPGVISAKCQPGGGTTDYAVDIFHGALKEGAYTCFLSEGVELPFMYMPDCLAATWQLMTAPKSSLRQTTYNVTATSFTPAQLSAAIADLMPGFKTQYAPDFRDAIARSWPVSVDDSAARTDWNWRPRFDLPAMAHDMLQQLAPAYGNIYPAAGSNATVAAGADAAVAA